MDASLSYNHGHNILTLLKFDQIFLSPQVKRTATISNKHVTYELPHKLPNNLRLKYQENLQTP